MRGTTLEIRLLGPLEVWRDGRALELPPSRRARALLAYLVVTGRAHAREHLCELLWEGPADPRAALRGALSKLRPLVDGEHHPRLAARGDRVVFQTDDVGIDLAVARAAASRPLAMDVPTLEGTAGSFRGVFLEGLELSRCYRFDTWCAAQRETARRLHDSLLAALVERLHDEPEHALHHARSRLLLDPCSDAANLDVVRLLGRVGRPREALEQYDAYRRMLKKELGKAPSQDMEALRRALLPAPRAVPAPARPPPARSASRALSPLVGREPERAVLERAVVDAAARDGAVLVVSGEPGIGKTRLLDHLATTAESAGGMVIAGRAYEAELLRPYGAWIDALRSIPADEIPITLRPELAPLLPELGPAGAEPADRARLFDGIAALLAGCSLSRRPLVVLLDDIQWLDDASAALLHFVARRLADSAVIIACGCRPADLDDDAASSRLLRTLRRERSLREIVLAPLDAEATAALVQGVAPGVDAARVFSESEGNPLFALEIAQTGITGDLPGTLAALIDDRLRRLDADAQPLVPWAAALGHDFELETLMHVAELPGGDVLRGIEQLERRGVLRATGTRYDFAHDVIRKVAYGRISEPRRRLIHGRIAHHLDARDDPDHELAGDTAHHAALAGDHELAANAYLSAARRALGTFAPAAAAELVSRGLRQLHTLQRAVRLPLQLELLGLSIYPGLREHGVSDLEGELLPLVAEARAAGLHAEMYRGLQIIAYLHFLAGDFGGAVERTLRAQEAGRGADPATVVRAIGDAARCLGIIERDMPRAQQLAYEAATLAEAIGYEGHELPQALGYVYHHNGALDDAVAAFERAAYLAGTERERWFESIALSRLVMIELERRRPQQARARCDALIEVTRQLGEGGDAPFAEALQALARLSPQDDTTTSRLDQAIARLRDVDSQWMVAYIQNVAAWLDLERGACESARVRAEEALHAAELVERRNEAVVARALLARIAALAQDSRTAREQIAAARDDLTRPGTLSARARRAVAIASAACSEAESIRT